MFKASQDITLINSKGKIIEVAKGKDIPDEFIPLLLRHNRNFIENLEYKNAIPVLTKEQEKKYGITFGVPEKDKGLKGKIKGDKYTQEKLSIRLNKLGEKKFKEWSEEEFGEKAIDRRKSCRAIIMQILQIQERSRR